MKTYNKSVNAKAKQSYMGGERWFNNKTGWDLSGARGGQLQEGWHNNMCEKKRMMRKKRKYGCVTRKRQNI